MLLMKQILRRQEVIRVLYYFKALVVEVGLLEMYRGQLHWVADLIKLGGSPQ